jgi:hypothetical protein
VVLSYGSTAVSASATAANSFSASCCGSSSDYLQLVALPLVAVAAAAINSGFMHKSVCACICVSAWTGRQPSAFRAHCAPKSQEQLEIQQDSHDVCTQDVPYLPVRTSMCQYMLVHILPFTPCTAMYCDRMLISMLSKYWYILIRSF